MEAVDLNLTRSIGVSNVSPEKIDEWFSDARIQPAVNQVRFAVQQKPFLNCIASAIQHACEIQRTVGMEACCGFGSSIMQGVQLIHQHKLWLYFKMCDSTSLAADKDAKHAQQLTLSLTSPASCMGPYLYQP